jgi:hypothetical protein
VSVTAAYLEQAESAAKANAQDRARACYEAAVFWAIDSQSPHVANEVAWSGVINGFSNVALPAAQFAVQADPDNGNYRDTRGVAECALGSTREPLKDFLAFMTWAQPRGGIGKHPGDATGLDK